MEIIRRPSVSIDYDKAVFETHAEHSVEELHVGLLVKILPVPLMLMEHLSPTGLQASSTEPSPHFPKLVERVVDEISRYGLCTRK